MAIANKKTKINPVKLAVALVLPLAVGWLGSIFTASSLATWYMTLTKPIFSPPSWLFAPVWTLLYLLMGVALYLVWQKGLKKKSVRLAVGMFIIHLFFNAIWSIIFFGLHLIFWAFIDLFILWILIIILLNLFSKINKTAAYLLLPYWLWVSFALILNLSLWLLN